MEDTLPKDYLKKALFIFCLLLGVILIINLIGNAWLYQLEHKSDNFPKNIFTPLSFLALFAFLVRDILISAILLSALFKLINVKIKLTKLLFITMIAEFVFVTQSIFDLIYTYTNRHLLNLVQIKDFVSFSIYNCIKNVPSYLYYATVTANLWEVLYMFVLALMLKSTLNRQVLTSFGLVILSYGVPLFLWVIFATFLQISNS